MGHHVIGPGVAAHQEAGHEQDGGGTEAEFLVGDLDQNGSIGINDVTNLIDIVLERTELPDSADVNRDGVVNISDVTDLIDLLISGNAK